MCSYINKNCAKWFHRKLIGEWFILAIQAQFGLTSLAIVVVCFIIRIWYLYHLEFEIYISNKRKQISFCKDGNRLLTGRIIVSI